MLVSYSTVFWDSLYIVLIYTPLNMKSASSEFLCMHSAYPLNTFLGYILYMCRRGYISQEDVYILTILAESYS